MSTTQYRKKPPRTDLFCRNADGEIVIVSKVWLTAPKGKAAVSLYVGRGIKDKALRLVHRELFAKPDFTNEELLAARDTVPLLWAIHFGIDNIAVVYQEPDMRPMFHPTELQQLQQEKQP